MTKNEYRDIKSFATNCIRKYRKVTLFADDVIHESYINLINKGVELSLSEIKKEIAVAVRFHENISPLLLENVRKIKLKNNVDYIVCSRCPENGLQPATAFFIRKIYPNGRLTYRVPCKKCLEGKSTTYYRKLKKENPTKYKEVLKKARIKGKTNYDIIKKNPEAYKIFRNQKNEINRRYENRKQDEKVKTGWKPYDSSRSPLMVYDKNGKYLGTFPSLLETAKAVNRHRATLSKAIKNNSPCAGFYFQYVKGRRTVKKHGSKKNWRATNKRPLIAKDLNGKIVATFPSITEAALTINRMRSNLSRAIRKNWRCAGYAFEFVKF